MKKLWILLGTVFIASFAVLGWIGVEIFRQAPPIPKGVVTTGGQVLIAEEVVMDGQNVWQAMGSMQVGSIWGHGSYVAPDWTADYMHREALFILNEWTAGKYGTDGSGIPGEQRAALQHRLQELVRTNTYDPVTGLITVDPLRARAFERLEPCEGKPSRTVLRGGGRSNAISLPDYAFGRTGSRVQLVQGRKQVTHGIRREREDWQVLIPGHHEGYITWSEYERNQRLIADNANSKGLMVRGAVRKGEALLAGLLRCGHCGRKLHVSYSGSNGNTGRYHCRGAQLNHGTDPCIGFGSLRVS